MLESSRYFYKGNFLFSDLIWPFPHLNELPSAPLPFQLVSFPKPFFLSSLYHSGLTKVVVPVTKCQRQKEFRFRKQENKHHHCHNSEVIRLRMKTVSFAIFFKMALKSTSIREVEGKNT